MSDEQTLADAVAAMNRGIRSSITPATSPLETPAHAAPTPGGHLDVGQAGRTVAPSEAEERRRWDQRIDAMRGAARQRGA